jgi:phenylalanyl-tRNA synthetase beta chain
MTSNNVISNNVISDNLDSDVTNFLSVLNDVGSKIACVLSNNISPVKIKQPIDNRKIHILLNETLQNDHAHANIIEGINNLKAFLFEFGKNYHCYKANQYQETEHRTLYLSGEMSPPHWREKPVLADYFTAKGIVAGLAQTVGLGELEFDVQDNGITQLLFAGKELGKLVQVTADQLAQFDIRQPVFMIDLLWQPLMDAAEQKAVRYKEVNKFPVMQRDLSVVVDAGLVYGNIEQSLQQLKLPLLTHTRLFDVFESEKLGANKKSMALSFFFSDETKTLTDKEVDGMMAKIISQLEKEVQAEIRK